MKQPMNTHTASKSSNDFQGIILVIDDIPENLTILRKCLTDHQYRVAVARNGKVALERVKRIRPDLILLDVLMPGMDGFEVCRQLKADENTRAIPVIFMTALATAEDKVKGFEAGAEDYVTKPLNYQEVLARVHTHVTLYKLQQELRTRNTELQNAKEAIMDISITEATKEEKSIIQNLARFYIYDLSEFQARKCPDNGLFEDEDYSRYWTQPGHFPYLVRCQDELAGFVFVEEGGSSADIDYHIAEFFIVRKFRGKGVARFVARDIFQRFHGKWEVMAISQNVPAITFWEKIINEYTQGNYARSSEIHGCEMEVFRFPIAESEAER
jgi:DNA-binding response OmpR family regulator/predicted acetyltransferase